MAIKEILTWKTLFGKIIGGIILGMFGIVLGWFAGGIFETMSIMSALPWQEFLTFLGAIIGFMFGTQIE